MSPPARSAKSSARRSGFISQLCMRRGPPDYGPCTKSATISSSAFTTADVRKKSSSLSIGCVLRPTSGKHLHEIRVQNVCRCGSAAPLLCPDQESGRPTLTVPQRGGGADPPDGAPRVRSDTAVLGRPPAWQRQRGH